MKLKNKFIDMATEFDKILDEADILTNEEHLKLLLDDRLKLLIQISNDEKLDLEMLKIKYLNISNTEKKVEIINEKITKPQEKDELLDKIVLNNETYYYQPKQNGFVYNNKSQIVGSYINKKIIFN